MANSKKNIKKVIPAKKNTAAETSTGSKRPATKVDVKSKVQSELFRDNLSNADSKALKSNIENLVKSEKLDITRPFYIQINVNNIYNIFASGLISAQYSENKHTYIDIQSINTAYLLLSNGFIGRNEEYDILLEIDLTKSEIMDFETQKGVLLHTGPIPISRVKKILVDNESIKADISNNSLLGDAGFIPFELISLKNDVNQLYDIPVTNDRKKSVDPLLYKKFDKILGTFAYLANYNILLANRSNSIKTLPDHFFLAGKAINNNFKSIIDNERVLTFYKILFGQNKDDQPLLQWLVKRISEGSNFTNEDISKFANVVKESASSDFVSEADHILKLLYSTLGRKDVIKDIPNLKHSEKFYLYLFAILRQYGNLNTEDKSISRADLPDLIFPSYGQYTFAFLGYFYGYKSLRNFDDKINLDDSFFANSFGLDKRINLKFKLDTTFDLALIESVYQYVFNNKTESDILDYTKYPQILQTKSKEIILERKPYNVHYQSILGKQLYSIEKTDLVNQVEKLLENITIVPAISIFGAACYRNQVKVSSKDIVELKESAINYYLYFKKEDIMSTIKQGKIKPEDAIKDILLSLKENEF